MAIPKRQEVVAPLSVPVRADVINPAPAGAFGENIAQAAQQLGQSINQAGKIFQDIEIQKVRNNEAKLQKELNTKRVELANGLNNGALSFDKLDDYLKEFDLYATQKGQELLGTKGFDRWKTIRDGQQTLTAANIDLSNDFALFQNKKNILDIENMNNDAANDAVMNKENAEQILKQQEKFIDESALPEINKKDLKYKLLRTYTFGQVERDIQIDPQKTYYALRNDKTAYMPLTPAEKQKYQQEALKIAKQREGTTQEAAIAAPLDAFQHLFEKNPELAAQMAVNMNNNPKSLPIAKNVDKYFTPEQYQNFRTALDKLTPAQRKTYINAMQDILNDKNTEFAIANNQTVNRLETLVNAFKISDKDFKIENKDLRNVDSVVGAIINIEGAKANGSLYNYSDKTNAMLSKLRGALGQMVEDDGKGIIVRDTMRKNFLSNSADEAVKKAIVSDLRLANLSAGQEVFSKEAVGDLTEKIWTKMIEQKINTSSTATEDVDKALGVERNVLKTTLKNMFNLSDEKFEQIIYGDKNLPYYRRTKLGNTADYIADNYQNSQSQLINAIYGAQIPYTKQSVFVDRPLRQAISDKAFIQQQWNGYKNILKENFEKMRETPATKFEGFAGNIASRLSVAKDLASKKRII
jgi:predicted transcriptional regulator